MDYRTGNKRKLRLSAKRKKCTNINKFNRARRADLPCLTKALMGITNIVKSVEPQINTQMEIESTHNIENQEFEVTSKHIDTELGHVSESNSTEDSITIKIDGSRLVYLQHFLDSLIVLESHNSVLQCNLSNLQIVKEKRSGYISHLHFKCNMCGYKGSISTCPEQPNEGDINTAAVLGIMNIGAGYTQLQSFTASLDVPPMSFKLYKSCHATACNAWEAVAWKTMKEAAEEEYRIAVENGDVDENGIPMITVVCDGSWAKRSYRGGGNYNSLSGAAAIIGFKTRKVLYLGIKNKYCIVCQRAENKGAAPNNHTCYKNWKGTSTAMESAIIAEGFSRSIDMYNLIYSKMIADGDSSCYRKILDSRPYINCTVQKIECKNHLLRNYCNKLKEVAKTRNIPATLRNTISGNIIRARTAVTKAILYRRKEECSEVEKILNLRRDILNSLSHVFGEHKECYNIQYFCQKREPDLNNSMEDIRQFGLESKINVILKYLANHSRSLLVNVDTNMVEQFNSLICKYIGGKRVNFTGRQSYQGRCMAAAVSRNTKRPLYTTLKYLNSGISPGKILTSVERKKADLAQREIKKSRKRLTFRNECDMDKNYGAECEKADMDEMVMAAEKEDFLRKLTRSSKEYVELEQRTRLQMDSSEWCQQRKHLLTSSVFGKVCKMRPSTSCKNVIKTILYQGNIFAKSLEWGKINEDEARCALAKKAKVKIDRCGIFINGKWPYLGASPDGIINNDIIVEVKCPYAARDMTIATAVNEGKIKFLQKLETGDYTIKKNHDYFYQVQGQLNICNKNKCYFGIWSTIDFIHIEITRDEFFFTTAMIPKLEYFYKNCLLPEIIDPRHTRNLQIRDPNPNISQAKK